MIGLFRSGLDRLTFCLRNVKLQIRLIIAFILLSLIPLCVVSILSYWNSYGTLKKNTIDYSIHNVEYSKRNIDYMLEKYVSRTEDISTNLEIIKILKNYKSMTYSDKAASFLKVANGINDADASPEDLVAIEIMDFNGVIANTKYRITNVNVKDSAIVKASIESDKRIKWFATRKLEYRSEEGDTYRANNSMAVVMSTKIHAYSDGKLIGLLNIAMSEDMLFSAIKYADVKGNIYIADAEGNIVSGRDKSRLSTMDRTGITEKISLLEKAKTEENMGTGNFTEKIDGKNYIVCYAVSDVTGWRIISVIDQNLLMADINKLGIITIIIAGICLIFIIPISFIVTRSVTLPVKHIVHAMQDVERNKFYSEVKDLSRDEIGFLAQTFNNMVIRIRKLLTEVYEVRLKQREAEFKALVSQINPHFLYNTLDSINWMAYMSNHREISKMVNSLSRFFRLSLNKGNEFYTIKQEVEHIKSYISIQEIRYSNKINFNFRICEDTFEYVTIKLLLQPLVENAICHGIEPKGGKGNITIGIQRLYDKILMEVIDDGVGIGASNEKELTRQQEKEKMGGYGIKNINERIKLYFGDEFGLQLEAVPEGGTAARIWIPVVSWEEVDKLSENIAG